jgi:tRNA U34 5-methylaminomethyl-2-thiouridine-forming methyltransferase MnmC|tara:strand:- start:271 stop:951 length:681 start_codon:yes stop_codon:yes gene_type:complete
LKREFLTTGDGSITIHLPDWNEQYHSKHGAIAEAVHVFIKTGLTHWLSKNKSSRVSILEIGFGTGLNAFLTSLESTKKDLQLNYSGIEAYPISDEEIKQLNYASLLDSSQEAFLKLHQTSWGAPSEISQNFTLTKREEFFSAVKDIELYNIIYFDAFGARVQPELWTETVFKQMFDSLKPNGVLVTYSAKGSVRRAMHAVGFVVERLPGPPGKREMLRATKHSSTH